jgi:LmbE family N-acetylglucosaminyl deacetylase
MRFLRKGSRYYFPPLKLLCLLPLLLASSVTLLEGRGEEPPAKKLRVVIFGAHPDDPESGCGGLIALLTRNGHEVVIGYATCFRGGRRVGKELEDAVRRREATEACTILGAKPHFFDYAHEKLQADEATLSAVTSWLKKLQPDIVVTHWPLDTHPNHHVTSSLAWQAHLQQKSWSLYFFEVMTDRQTLGFHPELYLNVEAVYAIKKKALDCHRSQEPEGIWKVHDLMSRKRGSECGVTYAEAYSLGGLGSKRARLPVAFLGHTKAIGGKKSQ